MSRRTGIRTDYRTVDKRRQKPRLQMVGAGGSSTDIDPEFAPILRAFTSDALVTCRKTPAAVALEVNGKVFAVLVEGKLVAKLPEARVDALIQCGKGETYGQRRIMKQWVALPLTTAPWLPLAKEAYRFVKSAGSPRVAAFSQPSES